MAHRRYRARHHSRHADPRRHSRFAAATPPFAVTERRNGRDATEQDIWRGPIAVATDAANRQHYEPPPAFFERVPGKHLKYISCFRPTGCGDWSEAEAAMLDLSSQRAELADGQRILEPVAAGGRWPLFRETYGDDVAIWFQRWRIFFMACAELFGYRHGSEWGVSHYRFARR